MWTPRNRIMTAPAEGIAAQQSGSGQVDAPPGTVSLQCLDTEFTTTRLETAHRRKPRRDAALVDPDAALKKAHADAIAESLTKGIVSHRFAHPRTRSCTEIPINCRASFVRS